MSHFEAHLQNSKQNFESGLSKKLKLRPGHSWSTLYIGLPTGLQYWASLKSVGSGRFVSNFMPLSDALAESLFRPDLKDVKVTWTKDLSKDDNH